MSVDAPAPAGSTSAWQATAHDFLAREAYLLDTRRYEEWVDLFADDGVYWVPLDPRAEDAGETLNVCFEGPPRLRQRVARLRSGIAHAQEPASATVHSYSGVFIAAAGADSAVVRSALMVVESRFAEQTIVAGRCEHRLVRDGAGAVRIALRRVDLVGHDQALTDLSFVV